jgi:hypothetical protein
MISTHGKGILGLNQETNAYTEEQFHKRCAVDLFNFVWTLLEKQDRTQEDIDNMIHAAHASRYHWGIVGKPVNLARGEWQVSRVYSVLNRPEPAIVHAKRCLEICQEHGIGDFDLAFAYEALARAYKIAGNESEKEKYVQLAHEAAKNISKEEDRKYFESDMESI